MYKYDSSNSLVNLANSILKRFGVPTFHDSIPEVDEVLAKKKKIVVFLFDGMGKNVQDNNPKETSSIRQHVFKEITSTFPPTTAAATNAFLSGQWPCETGWLSWSQHFDEYGCNIDLFTRQNSQTKKVVPGFNYYEIAKYTNIVDLINQHNNKNIATKIMEYPIDKDGPCSIKEAMRRTKKALYQSEESFVYCYNTEPDHSCHEYGNVHRKVKRLLKKINKSVEKFAKDNPDVLCIVIADHGHKNVEGMVLQDYPDFLATLDGPFSFEGRSANFKVKKGQEQQFETLFNRYFGKYFELYKKQEVFDQQLFGPYPMPDKFKKFFNDYLAVSISDKYLCDTHEHNFFKGHHAGGTSEEMIINLSIYNKD